MVASSDRQEFGKMFYLMKSYGASWRLFAQVVDSKGNVEMHEALRRSCIWGGHDKTESVNDVTYLGYEFGTLNKAADALKMAAITHYSETEI